MDRKDHILIVDDDRDLRELLVQYFEKNEFTVTAAKNGREMRQTLADKAVDLIVLDLMMPHEDGLKLCRDLRAADAASPPILMLTARADEAERILGLEMGADDYLTNPFASRALLARVKAILRRARARTDRTRRPLARNAVRTQRADLIRRARRRSCSDDRTSSLRQGAGGQRHGGRLSRQGHGKLHPAPPARLARRSRDKAVPT